MEIIWIIGVVISYVILYYVIKCAVRNAIIEARYISDKKENYTENEGTEISKTICPNCGKQHDIDYPKCPFCKHDY